MMVHVHSHPLLRLALLLAFACSGAACAPSSAPMSPQTRLGAAYRVDAAAPPVVVAQSLPGQLVWSARDASNENQVETEYSLSRIGQVGSAILCVLPAGADPDSSSAALRGDARVAWAEPNQYAETAESRGHSFAFDDGFPDRSGYSDQFAAARVGLSQAHVNSTGRGTMVAVLDTGVDPTHPLLVTHLVSGYDFVDNDSDPREVPDGIDSDGDGLIDEALGHGSHVAGIVALVAPAARILPLRVLDNDGRGDAFTIARAIDYARLRGADVINLSLGMLVDDQLLADAIGRAHAVGIVVVASAGNWGAEWPEEYPAENDPTVAIAASGTDNRPASFTSFGSQVALCAPGQGIRSAFWNGNTAVWSGTSMSAPWVAGGAALLIAAHPDWSRTKVLARMQQTATPIEPTVPGATTLFGAGILNLGAALGPVASGDLEPGGTELRRATP